MARHGGHRKRMALLGFVRVILRHRVARCDPVLRRLAPAQREEPSEELDRSGASAEPRSARSRSATPAASGHCHRTLLDAAALRSPAASRTALTNVFTGRPARSIVTRLMRQLGPLDPDAPPFPTAAGRLVALRAAAEQDDDPTFTSLWSGQAAALARQMPAGELTHTLAATALQRLH